MRGFIGKISSGEKFLALYNSIRAGQKHQKPLLFHGRVVMLSRTGCSGGHGPGSKAIRGREHRTA